MMLHSFLGAKVKPPDRNRSLNLRELKKKSR
jgi:hypothetical protein